MPISTKERKGKTRWEDEPIHEFVARRLKESPPDERGSDPTVRVAGAAPSRRDVRTYFKGSFRFPNGIEIGGAEVYRRAPDRSLLFHAFVEDLSTEQMKELEAYAHNRRYMSQQQRRDQRREALLRRAEVNQHGHATTTAPIEEQLAAALRQMPNATKEQKRKMLEIMLDTEKKA